MPLSLPRAFSLAFILLAAASTPSVAAAPARTMLSAALDPDGSGLHGAVELSDLPTDARFSFRLRNDMTVDSIDVRGAAGRRALVVRLSGPADDLDSTRIWVAPGYRPAPGDSVAIRFHGGGQTTLNHYLGKDAAFTSGGSSAWYPETGAGRTIGRVTLDVPRRFTVRTSSPVVSDRISGARRHVVFASDHPTYFAFAAAPFVIRDRLDAAIPIDVALLKDRPDRAEGMRRLAAALAVEQRALGRFPFARYGVVEIPAAAGQAAGLIAASFESFLVVRSDFLDARGFALPVLAHEAGHQWWPGLVGRVGTEGDYMMDEALAQYAAYLAIEAVEGSAAGRAARRGEDRPPIGGVRQLAALAASGDDRPLWALPHAAASYELSQTRGALVYWQLARLIGPARFHAALQGLASEFAYRDIDWHTMVDRIEREAPDAARPAIERMLRAPAAPVLDLHWSQDEPGSVLVEVRSTDPDLSIPIALGVEMRDGTRSVRDVAIAGVSTARRLAVAGEVVAVTLDPAADIAWIPRETFARAQALEPYARASRLWNTGNTAAARAAIENVLNHLPHPDVDGVEFLSRSMLGEMMEEAGDLSGAITQYQLAGVAVIRPDDQLSALYAKMARAAGKAGRRELQNIAIDNLAAAVAATGLGARALARYRPAAP